MSKKEIERVEMMRSLKEKIFSQVEVAKQLGITARQVRRLKRAYETYGEEGLVSKKRGSLSNRKLPEKFRIKVMKLISIQYADYGPTLGCQKLQAFPQHDCS